MTLRPPRPGLFAGRRPWKVGGLLALCIFLLLAGPLTTLGEGGSGGLAAQDPLAEIAERYDEALQIYEEILEARDRALHQHDILMDRQEDARRSGDDDRSRDAMRRVYEQGVQVMLLDQQLRSAAAQLQAAGRSYLDFLERREDQLLDAIEAAILPPTRARLDRELSEVRQRYREVERESGAPTVGGLRPLPDVVVDRRDGPSELRGKAGLLENRAAEYESVIVGLQREITSRERRLQQERGRADLMAGISRFDDDALTGGGLTRPGSEEGGSNELDPTAPLNLSELPLPDQVVLLREYLGLAEEMRDEALALAETFRARADGSIR